MSPQKYITENKGLVGAGPDKRTRLKPESAIAALSLVFENFEQGPPPPAHPGEDGGAMDLVGREQLWGNSDQVRSMEAGLPTRVQGAWPVWRHEGHKGQGSVAWQGQCWWH